MSAGSNHQPLRVSWKLATPVAVGASPLHLDALIAFAATKRKIGLEEFKDASQSIRELADDLPLSKHVEEHGSDDWVWMASALQPVVGQPSQQAMRFFVRRPDVLDFAERSFRGEIESDAERARRLDGKPARKRPSYDKPYSGILDTQRGLFKQMYKHYPVKTMPELQAWCVGDMDELAALLDPDAGYITHLGARGRSGLGTISGFKIEVDESATTLWSRRVLPWPENDECEKVIQPIHPPYWAMENAREAYMAASLYY